MRLLLAEAYSVVGVVVAGSPVGFAMGCPLACLRSCLLACLPFARLRADWCLCAFLLFCCVVCFLGLFAFCCPLCFALVCQSQKLASCQECPSSEDHLETSRFALAAFVCEKVEKQNSTTNIALSDTMLNGFAQLIGLTAMQRHSKG